MSTRKVELVETHNLSMALRRMSDTPPYDQMRWRRALYHALGMSGCSNPVELELIRKAMELP